MKCKKIALFVSSLQKGGAERVIVNLAHYFKEQGYDVVLVTQYLAKEEYPLQEGIARVFSEIEEESSNRAVNFIKRYQKLRNIWKTEKPDVILSFIGKNNVMAILTAMGLHIPVVVAVRAQPEEEYASKALRIVANMLFPRAKGVVLQTEDSKAFFPQAVQKKVTILKNSLSPSFMRKPYEGEREKRIVAVGRVDANKNHEMLIRAFAQIAPKYPEYSLCIYGDGECRSSLQELIVTLKLEQKITMPGAVSDVAEKIEKAGIFVLTSYSEGMPNTLMEAMALGIPSISTNCPCGGPKELIRQKENGLLVPTGDVEALRDAILWFIEHPEKAKAIGQEASKLQITHSPEEVNGAWKAYLESCIERK